MIDVKGLQKNYGGLQVLKGVDLTINKGDCVVLVGPSGCGKKTLLRIIGGFLQPSEGKVLVDGLGVGDVGAIVLRDRKHLAQDGLIIAVATIDRASGDILAGPDVVSRGFVYVRESEELMTEAQKLLTETLQDCLDRNMKDWNTIKGRMKDNLSDFIFTKTKRSPMILPIIMEL